MQYRGRVKGREPNNAYAVARLHEPLLVQGDSARRLDLAVVGTGGGTGRYYRHARLGDCPREARFTGTAAGDVRVHHFDVESGAPRGGMKVGPMAIGREGLEQVSIDLRVAGGSGEVAGVPGPVRAGLVDATVADGEPAASRLGLSGAA